MRRFRQFVATRSPQALFLWLAIPALLLFIFIIPPLEGWDETTHFLRAYQVSTGDFISEKYGHHAGGLIPDNIVDMTDRATVDIQQSAKTNLTKKLSFGNYVTFLKQSHPTSASVIKYFSGSAVYSPVSYAPQSVGIYIARTLRLPLLFYDYIGRIFGAAFFVLLAYWAIRLAPRGKWALFAIAVLPTSLAAAATLSPDGLVNGASLLMVGIFLKGLLDGKLALRYLLATGGAIIVLSLTKQTYFVFALLPLLLPPKRTFGSVKRYVAWNAIFIIAALILTLGWYAQVKDTLQYSYLESTPNLNINPGQQESYVIHHPLTYLGTFGWQFLGRSNSKFIEMVGTYTWKGIVMPYYLISIIYLGLLLSFIWTYSEEGSRLLLKTAQRRFSQYGPIILGVILTVLIFTALYVSFNSVGAHDIQGVQGRYFIPLLPLLLPAVVLMKKAKKSTFALDQQTISSLMLAIFIAGNLAALFVILATNYIPTMQFV